MRGLRTSALFGVGMATLLGVGACGHAEQPAALRIKAPEFADIQEWINTKPLQMKDLRGQVVVLHFWAFG